MRSQQRKEKGPTEASDFRCSCPDTYIARPKKGTKSSPPSERSKEVTQPKWGNHADREGVTGDAYPASSPPERGAFGTYIRRAAVTSRSSRSRDGRAMVRDSPNHPTIQYWVIFLLTLRVNLWVFLCVVAHFQPPPKRDAGRKRDEDEDEDEDEVSD